jgi:uncharacterized protein YaiL (DUF2058 family)
MSMSLRDQLLQAGLATEKQAKEAERQLQEQQRQRQRLPKDKRASPPAGRLEAQQGQMAKVARDQELSRQRAQQAQRKAQRAEIAQLVEQNRLPRVESDERYNFVDGNKVRAIPADRAVRERLNKGEIAIVRGSRGYEFVPAETAARIRERDEHSVVKCGGTPGDAVSDDGVPDNLIW